MQHQNDILKKEEQILAEEKEILKEVKKTSRRTTILSILSIIIVLGGFVGIVFWQYSSHRVYTDKAAIAAPRVDLGVSEPGTLDQIYVHEGDSVPANTVVARAGTELIKTTSAGIVIATSDNIGKTVNPGEPIVSLIDPSALRVVGQIDEDKGLADVQVGDRATFTVDGFSKTYVGTVDEIGSTSHADDVVFNISDKREVSVFDVKVRFDVTAYPELKNGMTAKLTILKD